MQLYKSIAPILSCPLNHLSSKVPILSVNQVKLLFELDAIPDYVTYTPQNLNIPKFIISVRVRTLNYKTPQIQSKIVSNYVLKDTAFRSKIKRCSFISCINMKEQNNFRRILSVNYLEVFCSYDFLCGDGSNISPENVFSVFCNFVY